MMAWYEMALWPFQLPFMVQAMVIAVLVAVPTALLSCFLVLKGWSLMGDAIGHAVLPGVVLAYVVGLPLGLGAFIAGMVCALSVGFLKENSRIKEDTVMGVVFSGLFGLGIVLYTAITTDVHLDHILFGNMLGTSADDLLLAGAIALVVVGVIAAKWRDLMLFIFDAQQAGAIGLRTRLLHYGLLAMISLTIVGALQAVGMILVIALLIAPGAHHRLAAQFQLRCRLHHEPGPGRSACLTANLSTLIPTGADWAPENSGAFCHGPNRPPFPALHHVRAGPQARDPQ
jgi:manganese/iron transport system permease protein